MDWQRPVRDDRRAGKVQRMARGGAEGAWLQVLPHYALSCQSLRTLCGRTFNVAILQRYSHLRKHFYALTEDNTSGTFTGLHEHSSTERMRFIHPISTLAFGARSLPSDLALEPADTLSLYHALVARRQDLPDIDLAALDPVVFFKDQHEHGLLKQMDVIRYENALKAVVEGLLQSFNPEDDKAALYGVTRKLEDPVLATMPQGRLNSVPSKDMFKGELCLGSVSQVCRLTLRKTTSSILCPTFTSTATW
jgi:hypothetical protein